MFVKNIFSKKALSTNTEGALELMKRMDGYCCSWLCFLVIFILFIKMTRNQNMHFDKFVHRFSHMYKRWQACENPWGGVSHSPFPSFDFCFSFSHPPGSACSLFPFLYCPPAFFCPLLYFPINFLTISAPHPSSSPFLSLPVGWKHS